MTMPPADGNPVEYNKSAREFDIVTLDRVKRIDIEPDLNVWKEYASAKGLHPSVLSYLSLKREHFYHIENTADRICFVTARGWEDLSAILYGYEDMHFAPNENRTATLTWVTSEKYPTFKDSIQTSAGKESFTSFTQNIVRITGFLKFSPDPLMNPL